MKIAIVGAGISGLVAARLLRRRHEIVVFEEGARPGGHANTVEVELGGERHAIDTGFIVYNERTYPLFTRLLGELGVPTQPSDMSFGVACEGSGVEWASRGLTSLFAQRRNLVRPSFLRMLRDVLRFQREAPSLLEAGDEKVGLGDYLCGAGYSPEFVAHYAVPMGAAIWSADPEDFLRFPAASFVRFFRNHGLLERSPSLPWRVISGGSRRYVEALVAPFRDRVRSGCGVRRLRRSRDAVEIETRDGGRHVFERAVLAVHADEALRLLADASAAERQILGSIPYRSSEALLHSDASVMPSRRRAWASWNYRIPAGSPERAFVTYHMNRLQGLRTRHDVFVTLNGGARVGPERVLGRFTYRHPVFDAGAMAAQKLHARIDGVNRTHFCGAYWGYGFHEDGVRSAFEVARKLGAER
jgi:predicted NAD/FAD-binding protein